MLSVRNITKTFGEFALQDVSFDVAEGEYFVLLGPSGVGKTVLLETIAGLYLPRSGDIGLDGEDITREKIQNRGLALVYHDRSLFPHMSVRRNVAYSLRARRLGRAEIHRRVMNLAEAVGIEALLDRYPATLSGGESQRVALARALATEPRCLLLDEPIASLDSASRAQMRSLLRTINRNGQAILHVTHDYEEAVSLASRVAIMDCGRIVQIAKPADVFRHPRSRFVANFMGIRNFFRGALQHANGDGDLARFLTSGLTFRVLTDDADGCGHLMIRSEDVIVSATRPDTSALNVFEGVVVDIAPARVGVEVVIDVGMEIASIVSAESVDRLSLTCGRKAWVSFKASAARFLKD